MSLITELNTIREQQGMLTPEGIVEAAAAPEHPLHSRFEWDDAVAGHQYRLRQAQELLRVTFKPDPTKATELRAFMAVRGENTLRAEYVPTMEAFSDPFLRELSLRQMKRDWKAFEARYKIHAQFAEFIKSQIAGESA